MKYLLDTCFISELIKKKPNRGVVNWLEDNDEHSLFLSALTLGEIKKGISKLPNSKKKEELGRWLLQLQKHRLHCPSSQSNHYYPQCKRYKKKQGRNH